MPYETKEQEKNKENICERVTAERVRRVIQGVPKAKNESLREGLGGSFSYFRLGKEFHKQAMLDGRELPSYQTLAGYVFFTATGEEFEPKKLKAKEWFIGTSRERDVFLIYNPDVEKLKDMALNLDQARRIAGYSDRRKLVFAPTKYLDQEHLDYYRIDFCQLPFEIYQVASK
jgi:adenine-specific DNA-methyltransferase